jgi:hypothetical protein
MQEPNLTPEQKKSKLKGVHSQTDSLVKSILTPPQYKQWETIRKDEKHEVKTLNKETRFEYEREKIREVVGQLVVFAGKLESGT